MKKVVKIGIFLFDLLESGGVPWLLDVLVQSNQVEFGLFVGFEAGFQSPQLGSCRVVFVVDVHNEDGFPWNLRGPQTTLKKEISLSIKERNFT